MASPNPANVWRRQVRTLRTLAYPSKSTCFRRVQQDIRCLACWIESVFYVSYLHYHVQVDRSVVSDDHPSCLQKVRGPVSRYRTFHMRTRGLIWFQLIHSTQCWPGVAGNCEARVL